MLRNARWTQALVAVMAVAVLGGCQQDPDLGAEVNRLNTVVLEYEKENQRLAMQMEELARREAGVEAQRDALARKVQVLKDGIERMRKTAVLSDKVQVQLENLVREFGGTLHGRRLQLPGDYLFSSGSYNLTPASDESLKKLAQILKDENLMLMVVGHTDSDKVRRSKSRGIKDNRHLSLLRAWSVVEAMRKHGYPDRQMYPVGWGELLPIASNDTAAGKKLNRRVEILIDPAASGLFPISAIYDVEGAGGQGAVTIER